MYVYMYIRMYACVCVCVYIHIYIYMHPYIHTYMYGAPDAGQALLGIRIEGLCVSNVCLMCG